MSPFGFLIQLERVKSKTQEQGVLKERSLWLLNAIRKGKLKKQKQGVLKRCRALAFQSKKGYPQKPTPSRGAATRADASRVAEVRLQAARRWRWDAVPWGKVRAPGARAEAPRPFRWTPGVGAVRLIGPFFCSKASCFTTASEPSGRLFSPSYSSHDQNRSKCEELFWALILMFHGTPRTYVHHQREPELEFTPGPIC